MIDKYKISEKRIVTIYNGEQRLNIEVPFNFVITEKWIDNQFNDTELTKCINWLKKKGFVLNNNKWDLIHIDTNHHIKLPQYFIDDEKNKLRVCFGKVEARSFYFPRPNRGYCSLKGFPTYLPKKCTIDMNNSFHEYKRMSWIDFTSVDVYKKYIYLDTNGDDIDSYYFKKCFDILKEYETIATPMRNTNDDKSEVAKKGYSIESFFKYNQKELFENEDFCNVRKSLYGIEKFNL